MSDLSATERRTAAQHLATVWNDGKRRVVVAQRAHFRHNGQSITKDPTEVIDDPYTIALLDEHGIDYIELEVNGQPKRGKLLPADEERNANVDAVAEALHVAPSVLHLAIAKGGAEVAKFAEAAIDGARVGFVPEGRVLLDLQPEASLDDAIGLLSAYEDPHAAAVAQIAGEALNALRVRAGVDASTDWEPGKE